MTKKKIDPKTLLSELLAITNVEDRIRVVAEDVKSETDKYRTIDAFDLAEALGAPDPEDLSEWDKCTCAEILSLEEASENRGGDPTEDIQLLCGEVSEARYAKIEAAAAASDESDFSYLLPDERETLERLLAEDQLQSNLENGIGGIARCTVEADGVELSFEGSIEDDGTMLDLLSPYDERDGFFKDLDDCVVEEY